MSHHGKAPEDMTSEELIEADEYAMKFVVGYLREIRELDHKLDIARANLKIWERRGVEIMYQILKDQEA